ncbi:uncharacterized protein FIBRA_04394 [Fibroporia radiculosa]|uniref:Uncharacterized protein n=1 Tax=Fibroporia radiculosa TaxID=599839 RepID=J4H2X9_9APHY|nr:uncharacterized protein FIBRA_04394 [Fibroporia radiculosa]CCM02304.1 predicted protein [Fibroporia radiculosa]
MSVRRSSLGYKIRRVVTSVYLTTVVFVWSLTVITMNLTGRHVVFADLPLVGKTITSVVLVIALAQLCVAIPPLFSLVMEMFVRRDDKNASTAQAEMPELQSENYSDTVSKSAVATEK